MAAAAAAAGAPAAAAADAVVDRLGQAVTSSRLWLPECAAQQPPLPSAVPSTFISPQQYLSTFTPLLLEEAVESVRASYEECERKGKGATVTLTQCQELQDGWRKLTLKPASPPDKQQLLQLQRDRDAAVVVLTLRHNQHQHHQQQQQQDGAGEEEQEDCAAAAAAAGGGGGGVVRVTGVVARWEVDSQECVLVRVRPWCGCHEWGKGPCCKVYPVLRGSSSTAPTTWQLTPAGSTVTAQRELNTLNRLQHIPLLPYLLNPAAIHAQNPAWDQQQQQEEGAAAAGGAAQQQPPGLGVTSAAEDNSSSSSSVYSLPEEVAGSAFKLHLDAKFDRPQAAAILRCAAHVALTGSNGGSGSNGGGGRASGSNGGSNGSRASGGSSSGGAGHHHNCWWCPPVSLIQGPPGTGKTYTVLGVLNLWHMVLYHRHYASLDAVVRRLLVDGGGSSEAQPGTRIDRVLLSDGFSAQLAPRPRILVCAPSNAATDELLERVMRGGFIDKNGNKYNPNMIRLGSEEALSSAAQEVWVEQLAGRLLALDPRAFHAEQQALQQDERGLITVLANCGESVAAMRTLVADAQAAAAAAPDDQALQFACSKQADNLQQVLAKLVGYFERLRVIKVELRRRAIVQDMVVGPGAKQWALRMQKLRRGLQQQQQHPQQQQQQQRDEWRQAFRMCPRDLQQQLELSYIEAAEMVFTTLSSSGRDVFQRLAVPFPLVLLDEAGQATEVASLQPLVYGARGVVMVGDPQQLPATIFSQAGKQLALERSLFERLAAGGCPVSMLRVQYRMHPAIRTFPSAFFYSNALLDADSVLLREGAWYLGTPPAAAAAAAAAAASGGGAGGGAGAAAAWSLPADPRRRSPTPEAAAAAAAAQAAAALAAECNGAGRGSSDGGSSSGSSSSFLLPYGVFDVAAGVEHSVGRSKANAAEADLAVELYSQLRPALVVQEAASAAEAAARQELLLALPTNVGIVTPYRGQRDLIRDKLAALFGPQELCRVRVETIDSFQGKQLDVVILSLVRASGGGGGGGAGAGSSHQGAAQHNNNPAAAVAAGAAAAAAHGNGNVAPPRAGVGFLSDVRRMNVAITRARLACLVLGRVATLRQDAAWSALVRDAAARGCLFQVPSAGALSVPGGQHQQQQHPQHKRKGQHQHQHQHHHKQQRQQLLSLIAAAREEQEAVVVQLRQQRQLRLPTPPPPPAPLPPPPPALQQQQQQHNLQQQQQQQDAAQAELGRPAKQPKLDPGLPLLGQQQPSLLPAAPASGLAAAAAARGLPINTAAAAAATAAAPQQQLNPAVRRAAAEAGRGSAAAYAGLQPGQAAVAWGLWPQVLELQQQIVKQRQHQQQQQMQTQQQTQQQQQPPQ